MNDKDIKKDIDNKKVGKKAKKKLTKEQKIRIISIAVVTLITLLIAGLVLYKYKFSKTEPEAQAVKIENKIESYGYELKDTDTDYYKELFNKLKTLLLTEGFDEKEYATLEAQMFLADFYNLDNKLTNSDIGGTQFVYADYVEDFKSAAQHSVYKSILNNIYGDRNQELPKITKVSIDDDMSQKAFKYGNNTDSKAYYITADLSYEKDLNYPKTVKLVLIHNDKKLEVAKMD